MNKLGSLKVWGTLEGSDKSEKLDEISLLATPEVVRALGVFLINAAYEMEVNDAEHRHLQDSIENFSYESHVDIVVINQEKVKPVDSRPDKWLPYNAPRAAVEEEKRSSVSGVHCLLPSIATPIASSHELFGADAIIRRAYVPALNSIRRFRARPSAVSFGAIGWSGPTPLLSICCAGMPRPTR